MRVTTRHSSVAGVCLAGLMLLGGARLLLGAGGAAPADVRIVDLGGTPARGVDRGIKYSAEADNQSWAAMLKLFKEIYP